MYYKNRSTCYTISSFSLTEIAILYIVAMYFHITLIRTVS